jgi:hypothetical protein
MLAGDMYDTKLFIAECENCEKKYEVKQIKNGLEPVIKEIIVS